MYVTDTIRLPRPRLGLMVLSLITGASWNCGPKGKASTTTLTLLTPTDAPLSTILLDVLTLWLHKVHLHDIETLAGLFDEVVDMIILLWSHLGVPEDHRTEFGSAKQMYMYNTGVVRVLPSTILLNCSNPSNLTKDETDTLLSLDLDLNSMNMVVSSSSAFSKAKRNGIGV
jgi:hypothetical protein